LCPTIRGGKNVPRENSRSEGDCEVISKPCQRENLSLLQGKCRSLAGWLAGWRDGWLRVLSARDLSCQIQKRARAEHSNHPKPPSHSLALGARVYFLSAAQSRRIHFVCLKRYSSLFFIYIYSFKTSLSSLERKTHFPGQSQTETHTLTFSCISLLPATRPLSLSLLTMHPLVPQQLLF
jgi:hypothetical protein